MQIRPTASASGLIINLSIALFHVYTEFGIDSVPIYFYYLTISKQKDSNDSSTYDMQQIVDSFSKLLPYITEKI